MENRTNYYYDVADDLEKYPDANFIFIYGGRATGKTYSALRYVVENEIPFCFMKRTKADVSMLCAGRKLNRQFEATDKGTNRIDIDVSPFAPLNRDFGWNIKAYMLDSQAGIGVFIREDEEGNPYGKPLGYLLAISGAGKYKGFDLTAQFNSKDFFMIFDEFVPPAGTKKMNNGDEGEMLFDLYMTLSRDRKSRGANPIKLICLANPDTLVSPIILAIDVINDIAYMQRDKQDYYYNEEKCLLIHRILNNVDFIEKEKDQPIYKLMKGTEWEQKSLYNKFDGIDFDCIGEGTYKNYKCEYKILYKNKTWYTYHNSNKDSYIMTTKKPPQEPSRTYDLSKDIDIVNFDGMRYYLLHALWNKQIYFERFEMKHLVRHYYQYFSDKLKR